MEPKQDGDIRMSSMFQYAQNVMIQDGMFISAAGNVTINQLPVYQTLTDGMLPETHHEPKSCPPLTNIFTGRQEILEKLDACFNKNTRKPNIFVLYGLGGAGKTQIMLKFISECPSSRFSDVFFIDASSKDTIKADLEVIALSRKIGKSKDDTLRWLGKTSQEWLLIYDNADDPKLNIGEYLPKYVANRPKHGNIIITTRNPKISNLAPQTNCEVSSMTSVEARDLLLCMTHSDDPIVEDIQLAEKLVEALHYFPLAIVQAGASIGVGGSLSDYLDLYIEYRDELLAEERSQHWDDYEWTVYTTWNISFQKLSSIASQLLQLCSFLHFNGITEAIFKNATSDIAQNQWPIFSDARDFLKVFSTPQGCWDALQFRKIIKEIQSFSLINEDTQDKTYAVHPLVHSWCRTTVEDTNSRRSLMLAILAMSIKWRFKTEDYAFRQTLLPHIPAVLPSDWPWDDLLNVIFIKFSLVYDERGFLDEAEKLQKKFVEANKNKYGENHAATLLGKAHLAATYTKQARYQEAEELYILVLEASKRALGENHLATLTLAANLSFTHFKLDRLEEAEKTQAEVTERLTEVLGLSNSATLTSMANLALTQWERGRLNEAQELLEKVIENRKQILGEDHPDTLASVASLASLYGARGRLKEGESLFKTPMEKRKQTLAEDHPVSLVDKSNLALMHFRQGRLNDAEVIQVKIIEKMEQIGTGMDHPHMLLFRTNLASTYFKQGRLEEAEAIQKDVAERCLRVFGDGHNYSLASNSNLACTYRELGRLDDAEKLEKEVLKYREQKLGDDHPHTLTSMTNLAVIYKCQGRLNEAVDLQEVVLDKRKRILGEDHPDTLTSMTNLAATYWSQGEESYDKAESLQLVVMEKSEQTIGKVHPDTLTSIANLAMTYHKKGNFDKAVELLRVLVERMKDVVGEDHSDMLLTKENLASAYQKLDRWVEAKELQLFVMETRKRTLGEEHLDTLKIMANLAVTHWKLNSFQEAEILEMAVMNVRKRKLGKDHPSTLSIMENLAMTYSKLGRLEESEKLFEMVKETRKAKMDSE